MMRASIAIFTVKDVMASLAYFRDKLGFDVAFEYGSPTYYVGLCSGEVSLHLVDALHADLVKRGARVLKAPKDYDYGLRDFDVADLDGNMIFFGMESQKAS
jgi:catechol 2,3-dioxygenase-like lactoylglutathione lyase family enzyme